MANQQLSQTIKKLKNRLQSKNPLEQYNELNNTDKNWKEIIKENYLKVISWNVGKMKDERKRELIKKQLLIEDPDIVILQETNIENKEDFEIAGWQTGVTEKKEQNDTGLLYLVRDTILFEEIKVNGREFGTNIEKQIIKITLLDGLEFYLINLYRNPTKGKNAVLDALDRCEYMEKNKRVIVMGDFNAHNPLWTKYDPEIKSTQNTCVTGENIEKALNLTNIVLLNNKEYTYTKMTKAGLTKSALDLTFTTKNLATKATWSTNSLYSDHFGITLYLQTGKLDIEKTPKKRYEKANWDLYKQKNDELINKNTNGEINTIQKLESESKTLIEMFNKSAEHSIPMTKAISKNKQNNKNPKNFVTERTKELNNRKNQLVRIWKREKDNDKKIELLEDIRLLEKQARQEEFEEAEKHMLEWCEKLDSDSSLSYMWGKIKNLEGRSNPQLHPEPKKSE